MGVCSVAELPAVLASVSILVAGSGVKLTSHPNLLSFTSHLLILPLS